MQSSVGVDSISITIAIDEKLTQISPSPSECCIFRVHKQQHGVNEKAYEPETVAIGIVPNRDGSNKKGNWHFIPNTIELREAGVKLVKIEGASLFDVKFENGFMDCLIDSPKDVEIPSRHGIIDDWLGDNEVVSTIFNKISDTVTGLSSHF
ncbi:hypothetical protein TEA_027430 [Camellia sinensis var. sinensis]|uniref:Uncharacterized protein n=1 Tax=Camellia sinensis var. sinensis TaxID=542762 RepID=A0A4S4ESW7_CAMSN|nr:hypothetical protein TEA_027430 [Camellia sinensis var. sinensis]